MFFIQKNVQEKLSTLKKSFYTKYVSLRPSDEKVFDKYQLFWRGQFWTTEGQKFALRSWTNEGTIYLYIIQRNI